jgi:hypothetical protein
MAADKMEWPEFRQWYDLMLEKEALFGPGNTVGESGTDDDNRYTAVSGQIRALRAKMQARPVTSSAQEAAWRLPHFIRPRQVATMRPATFAF